MKGLFFVLLSVGALACLGLLYLSDPGSIQIIWLGVEIRLSVIVAGCICLMTLWGIWVLKWIFSRLVKLPFEWLFFNRTARERKAKNALLALFSSLEAENITEALYHQKKAEKYLSTDPLFLWIAGNTFDKAGQPIKAEQCFVELTKNPLTTFLGLKGQAQTALRRGDSKFAYALLEQAQKCVPTSPWVLKHLLALAQENKDLKKAEELILFLEDLGYDFPTQ